MNRVMTTTVALAAAVGAGAPALGAPGDTWILGYTTQGTGWNTETGGNYDGADYHWAAGQDDNRVGYWLFDDENVLSPGSPAISSVAKLYLVEQWVPSNLPVEVTEWEWLQIEVTFDPGGGTDEEGEKNWNIPWDPDGTNHQWLGMPQDGTQGDFQPAGVAPYEGPHAPDSHLCAAGPLGSHVWMQKGSTLYSPWSLETGPTHAMTALRITDPGAPAPEGCEWDVSAIVEGAVDLSEIGNADPLYYADEGGGIGEAFSNSKLRMVRWGDATYGAEGYKRHHDSTPLSPGLPQTTGLLAPVGLYTAHLTPEDPAGDVDFVLQYTGLKNTIKWRTDDESGDFRRGRVFTLNDVPGREFEEGNYDKLYFLSSKSGSKGMLHIEVVYSDDSTESFSAQLYDWFGQNGDQDSIAVGVDGYLRSEGDWVDGFKRLNTDGGPDGGGDHGGAFLFVHAVDVDESKTLKRVLLSVGEDANGLNGSICVFAATFIKGLACNDPAFDADGDTDVDHDDFGAFQACFTSVDPEAGVFDWENCGCLDRDGDQDVDEDDYSAFEACASGPDVPADPQCDDAPPP